MSADSDREVWCLKIGLGSPIAGSDPYIHLDAFVSYAAAVEAIGHEGIAGLEDGDEPEYFEEEMPFARYEDDSGEWVWATSAAAFADLNAENQDFDTESWDSDAAAAWFDEQDPADPTQWTTTKWRYRFNQDSRHQAKETHVNVSTGPGKSYNAALPYTPAESLTYFFELKDEYDPQHVVDMIEAHVSGIGKKRSQGYGRIRDVRVTDATRAVESAIYHGGQTLRSLPATFFDAVQEGLTYEARTVRPPYWHQFNQPEGLAVAPFTDSPPITL